MATGTCYRWTTAVLAGATRKQVVVPVHLSPLRPSHMDPYRPFLLETLTKFPTLTSARLLGMLRQQAFAKCVD